MFAMNNRPKPSELAGRIHADIDHYGGVIPQAVAIAWHAYLSALLEWSLLDVADCDALLKLLPEIQGAVNPVFDIMMGRDSE
jgi:hypothetical protein